ncbi:carbonic anhydrase [Clostridium massiliodielmoense]|uniref:carbonic anhydrase n=1 Tax=Clostridium massiliodielmoense TaxID=1776385 RepID=UPI000A26AF3D|nr:carbonic anhydrase [Clostridium massiliodielmoense]
MRGTFAVAINCIDGRVQNAVRKFIKDKYHVDYVDMVTEAGPDKILAEGKNEILIQSIKDRVVLSVDKHEAKVIAVVGHFDCAGNPVDKEQHIKDIREAVKRVESWGLGKKVIGIWVNHKWKAEQVA